MKYIKVTILIFLLGISGWISAAEFCVTNSMELRSALGVADNNNEHDVIKIAQGSYETAGNVFNYYENQGWDLEISGGWNGVMANDCGQQFNDPYTTILDGMFASKILVIQISGDASFKLSNLYFADGLDNKRGGGGLLVTSNNFINTGTITIENNAFINNGALTGSALIVKGAEKVYVRNNLFAANTAAWRHVIEIEQVDGYGIYFSNNTVMFNDAVEQGTRGGVFLSVSGTSKLLIANNIILENDIGDLRYSGIGGQGDMVFLKHNNYGVVIGNTSLFESFGNFNLPPRFDPGILNFTPSLSSPLVNAGIEPCSGICQSPPPFDETWSIGTSDLAGNLRTQNGQVDIGAFESAHNSDLIFWDRFE